jgi:alkylation response protein AidB-like acyl-CoA dehydrogenase
VGKRLLQHERSGIGGLSGGARRGNPAHALANLAKEYIGEDDGRIADPALRNTIIRFNMHRAAFQLTAERANEENRSGTPAETTSIFKLVGAAIQQDAADLRRTVMGVRGLGAEGAGFSAEELTATEEWLHTKATTIYGGSNEIQANIIAKRVLGLPE